MTLTFEVEGDPGVTAILDPVVGPLEVGDYGDRPWEDAAPDIVVFLADTFRADNLAAWGGAPDVAPNTNALAEASVRFLETRATSVWTLPTHASMFSGLFPLQHGAITSETKLSPDLLTIAEHLAAHGYRTGAITEGAFVSRTYGLDQGFAWFEERTATERPYPLTLAGALDFLDADDGRPVFLFVHTYRVHAPYRIGAEEDAEPERDLMRRIGVRMREIEAAGGQGLEKVGPIDHPRRRQPMALGPAVVVRQVDVPKAVAQSPHHIAQFPGQIGVVGIQTHPDLVRIQVVDNSPGLVHTRRDPLRRHHFHRQPHPHCPGRLCQTGQTAAGLL